MIDHSAVAFNFLLQIKVKNLDLESPIRKSNKLFVPSKYFDNCDGWGTKEYKTIILFLGGDVFTEAFNELFVIVNQNKVKPSL